MSTAQRIVVAVTLALAHTVQAQTDAPATSAATPSPAAAPTTASPSPSAPIVAEPPPVASPPVAPVVETPAPSFSPRECWDNFTEVFEDLSVQPPYSANTYIICPNQVHNIGFRYGTGKCCEDGEMPMIPRANTQYKCGEDGSLANNCTMLGGSFHVMFNDFVFGEELTGVTIQGFQFVAPQLHSVLAVGSGDVTFLDCVLKDQSNAGPVVASFEPDFRRRLTQEEREDVGQTPLERLGFVMSDEYMKSLDRRAHSRSQARAGADGDQTTRKNGGGREERDLQNKIQVISMERCFFMNCSQGDFADLLPTYGVVSAVTTYNAFVFNDCIFSDNVYDGTTPFGKVGYGISTLDTDTIMTNSCFIDNNFFGYGSVELFDDSSYKAEDNYVGGTDVGIKCQFIAFSSVVPSDPSNVTCVEAEATSCQASIYNDWLKIRPAQSPTAAPSAKVTRPTRPTPEPVPTPSSQTSGSSAAIPVPRTLPQILVCISVLFCLSL